MAVSKKLHETLAQQPEPEGSSLDPLELTSKVDIRPKMFYDFDERVTAPLHGFKR